MFSLASINNNFSMKLFSYANELKWQWPSFLRDFVPNKKKNHCHNKKPFKTERLANGIEKWNNGIERNTRAHCVCATFYSFDIFFFFSVVEIVNAYQTQNQYIDTHLKFKYTPTHIWLESIEMLNNFPVSIKLKNHVPISNIKHKHVLNIPTTQFK